MGSNRYVQFDPAVIEQARQMVLVVTGLSAASLPSTI